MTFEPNEVPASMAALLEETAARIGLSAAQMEALLECDLDTDHLLAYIAAVVSNRMN